MGSSPEIFAPGIVSVEANFEHSAAVFSPDGREVFWCTNVDWYTENRVSGNLRLYSMRIVDGKWTPPYIAPFVEDIRVERPVFSPDGNKLFVEFGSDPYEESDTDIYVIDRSAEGWSNPESVSPLINSPAMERLHCVTADGSLYFSRDPFTNHEEVFVSRWIDGKFSEPEKLGKSFNSDAPEMVILVEPNEEYMLIEQRNAQYTSDLCVSYKRPDGSWSERIKTPYSFGGFLALSPDGKYLFFLNEEICWMRTDFVEDLKPEGL